MRSNKHNLGIVLFLLIISQALIVSGLAISYITNPKRIVSKTIKDLAPNIKYRESEESPFIEARNLVNKNSIALLTKVKIDVSSKYIKEQSKTKNEYIKYNTLLSNINHLEGNININQDIENKKLLLDISMNNTNNPLISIKHYINDATEYYYIPSIKNNYVNYGINTYFESVNKTTPLSANLDYIINEIKLLLDKHLKDQYYSVEVTKTYNKVSLTIDNKSINEIINSVYKDLKKDKKSNEILSSLNKKLSTLKIPKESNILSVTDKVIFNVYTQKINYKFNYYELIFEKDNNRYTLTGTDKLGSFLYNNTVIFNYNTIKTSNGIKIVFTNEQDEKVGSFNIDTSSKNFSIDLDYNNDNKSILSNYKLAINNKQIDNDFNLRVVINEQEIINLVSTLETNINYNLDTEENISESLLKSSLTREEAFIYDNIYTESIKKLYE